MGESPRQAAALDREHLHFGLSYKRLEQGRFVWPPIVEGRLRLTPAQLALLVEGIDWRRTIAPEPTKRPEAV
jgi:transposase